jgi:hypothetical protein
MLAFRYTSGKELLANFFYVPQDDNPKLDNLGGQSDIFIFFIFKLC